MSFFTTSICQKHKYMFNLVLEQDKTIDIVTEKLKFGYKLDNSYSVEN